MEQRKYGESINAYENALRLNPGDEDTKYNLAYAQRMLRQQQNNKQNNQNKNQNQKKQDQQQQQQQQQQQKEQQQKEQQQQQEQKQQQEQQQKQAQKGQMSKEDAERMLEALKNDELKTLEKVNKKQTQGAPVKIEKDW